MQGHHSYSKHKINNSNKFDQFLLLKIENYYEKVNFLEIFTRRVTQ
jgi:hypothetical protein